MIYFVLNPRLIINTSSSHEYAAPRMRLYGMRQDKVAKMENVGVGWGVPSARHANETLHRLQIWAAHSSHIFRTFVTQTSSWTMSDESIIQVFEGSNVRIVWNEEEQEYYFSIADIVQVLTDSTDVKQYIKRMRARAPELNLRWGTICPPTRMKAADGKYYQTQAATLEGCICS